MPFMYNIEGTLAILSSYFFTLVWSYGYSKCTEMNFYIKEIINSSEQRLYKKVTIGDSCIVFINSPVFESHSLNDFLKNGFKLFKKKALEMIPIYGRTHKAGL